MLDMCMCLLLEDLKDVNLNLNVTITLPSLAFSTNLLFCRLSAMADSPMSIRSHAGLKPHQVMQPGPSTNRPALILRSNRNRPKTLMCCRNVLL